MEPFRATRLDFNDTTDPEGTEQTILVIALLPNPYTTTLPIAVYSTGHGKIGACFVDEIFDAQLNWPKP